jgi:hypothetical protein
MEEKDYAAEKDERIKPTLKAPRLKEEDYVLQIGYPWHYHYHLWLRKRAIT